MKPIDTTHRGALAAGLDSLLANDEFHARHIGPRGQQAQDMLAAIGATSIRDLITQTIPSDILLNAGIDLPEPCTEAAALSELQALAAQNQLRRTYIGAGYYNCITPEPIRRNVLENPGWYTAYTPYQAEISQGRLEALLNFQQMIVDLTGLAVSNASLLDEATAAAEAMTLLRRSAKSKAERFFVDQACHPQVIAVVKTRAKWAGIEVVIGDIDQITAQQMDTFFGMHLQSPDTFGRVRDFSTSIAAMHTRGAMVSVGSDLLALLLIKSPGAMGADVAIGSAQRFGVPLGFGGPHAAFMAARQELVRSMPGRLIGVSKDAAGNPALRMALQTREQHIRRDKATSNICTAQALLANMAAFYAIWHGPQGLRRIALRCNFMARLLQAAVGPALVPLHSTWFDTLSFQVSEKEMAAILERCNARGLNLRQVGPGRLGVSLDETVSIEDVQDIAWALTGTVCDLRAVAQGMAIETDSLPPTLQRTDAVLTHPVFTSFHSETEFMRYLKRLENKDYSLVHGMIPLGSCTMKLNAASEMAPVSWPQFANVHPFVPADQAQGYAAMIGQLERWLEAVTGFARISMQPNSGAQGEYAGLLTIRNFQAANGQGHRSVCLIPSSAHGTNPATAHMMGLDIVGVACDEQGNIDLNDLKAKIAANGDKISALMVTYPSTHGVFEHSIREICELVHQAGGQVYMDGANLNAQAGLTHPGTIGADVCHMNLHKTFCIPHGGGGPGMGPIGVAAHLAAFLPTHAGSPFPQLGESDNGTVSAAPYGSALILTISWMYIRMMGATGITQATEAAILNANYIARRLGGYFPVLFSGENGRIAHECILDCRHLKSDYGVSAEDVAKRLMDYGFHAPTLSFPVADTLMVEPTESESRQELDRFCDAMIGIHGELQKIAQGVWPRDDNPLKNAPHTANELASAQWLHPYSREEAVFPAYSGNVAARSAKFWPSVKRVDNAAGDRSLVCTCPPMSDYV